MRTAKRWLFTRNKMITVDNPDGVDMHDPDLAVEMIVESTSLIDRVTELAEKWQELALKPFDVDERTTQWIVQETKTKTEVRLMMSMFMAAESIRRGRLYLMEGRRICDVNRAVGRWPPKDKRRVVVDEGQARVDRRERREDEKGEDDRPRVPEERSAEVASAARRQT